MSWDGEERRNTSVCVHHDDLKSKLTDLHFAVYGNGDPKKSIYWMIQKNTEFIVCVKRIFWPLVITSIVGVSSTVVNLLINVYKHIQ